MAEALKAEVDHNYDFFQRNLAQFLKEQAGQYALLRSAKVVGFFSTPGDALRKGLSSFPDGLFSVQEVSGEPVEMGMMSVAVA